jgi:hypothetical protein
MTYLLMAILTILLTSVLFGAWRDSFVAGAWMFALLFYVLLLVDWVG